MPETPKYVTYGSCGCGCGGAKGITGCRFSLYPMSDRFVELILGAVRQADTSKVWQNTDALSTVYRGRRIHVLDAVRACFVRAFHEGVHMVMEATLSRGCPGDTQADAFLAADDVLCNEPSAGAVHFPVACKFSLYPMGVPDYMTHIAHVVNLSVDRGLYAGSTHYVSLLRGDVQDIFRYFGEAAAYCEETVSHYIFEITMSVNSPEDAAR